MTRWTSVDQPVTQTERRRVEYGPRHPDPDPPLGVWEFLGVIGTCILVLAVVAALAGCVTTELQTKRVHMTRTSVLSDVEVEATMSADGSISVRERQAQDAAGRLIDRIPVVTP